MSEHLMETRRRSRSKTPFLRSTCDHESCEHAGEEGHSHHHHKKKSAASPKVNTITEIEETVEVTSSSSTPTMKESQQKIKTSDYSSEDNSPESRKIKSRSTLESHQNKQAAASSSNMYTTTTTTTSSTNIVIKNKKLGGSSLAAATSTPKANYALESFLSQYASSTGDSINRGGGVRGGGGERIVRNIETTTARRQRLNEVTQNELNAEFERTQREEEAIAAAAANKTSNSDGHISRRSQNNSNRSFSRFFSSSFGSSEQSRDTSDHIAYKEYKRAGEYWKTTPKTDYTYSELSPHRRELAPGVVAMPNMSRRSLENHHERIHYMIERDPAQESYIRRRYESSKYAQNRSDTAKLVYDSGDEIDVAQFKDYGKSYMKHQSEDFWLVRILTTIVTTFSSVWQSLSGKVTGADDSALYRTRISGEERGFFGSIGHGISSAFIGFFRYIYLFISSVLNLDTWLLQSSNAESKGKKRFLLLLLILLPLLLLAAWLMLDESQRLIYLQRSQSLVPISTLFATLTQTLSASADGLRGYLQLPSTLFSNIITSHSKPADNEANVNLYNMQQNIQKSLSPEEYENMLNHINSYVQQLVEIKLMKQQQDQEVAAASAQMTPQMMLTIANVVQEQLGQIVMPSKGFDLTSITDAELDLIAQRAQLRLETVLRNSKKIQLTQAHLEQIRQLIQERIEVNNNHFYTTLEHIDLEALLARILAAPQLAKFIDARIVSIVDGKLSLLQEAAEGSGSTGAQVERQNMLIDEMNKEIAFIKLTLADKLSENQDLHQSISSLKLGQENLLQRLHSHELSTDKRFSALLSEIESKLSTLRDEQFTLLNQQIKLSLVEILGFKQANGATLGDVDLQNWVRNMFVAKDFLEQRLVEINARTNDKIREEIDRSGMLLMRDISERLKHEILLAVDARQNDSQAVIKGHINVALSEEEVKELVKNVLAIYDADKTGLVDFALESAGGQILSTRCTENYQTKSAQISVFGIPLWYPTNTPRVAISPNVQPGECWAFQGFPGFLVLKLNSLVYVTGFTLEHIPKSLSPNGRIDSAPRNFTVWGLEHEKDQEPVLFGEYEYADNDASLQYFPLQNKHINRPYEIVELRIESNHGHPAYTCLYRFRVHGKPPTT